jgi:two-component system, NtrC family, response regulator AtoC
MAQLVLVIEDEVVLGKNVAIYLERHGFEVALAHSAEQGLAALAETRPDAVVLDFNLPGLDGLAALAKIREADAGIPVIMMTGHGSVEIAVDAMKQGAYDFLTKPVALSKLRMVIERAFGHTRRDLALDYYQRRDAQHAVVGDLIGESVPMRALKQRLAQLRQAEHNMSGSGAPAVLILGETGARAAHRRPAARQAFRRVELRRDPRATARVGTVRTRARRLHRRARPQARPGGNRGRRNPVPR